MRYPFWFTSVCGTKSTLISGTVVRSGLSPCHRESTTYRGTTYTVHHSMLDSTIDTQTPLSITEIDSLPFVPHSALTHLAEFESTHQHTCSLRPPQIFWRGPIKPTLTLQPISQANHHYKNARYLERSLKASILYFFSLFHPLCMRSKGSQIGGFKRANRSAAIKAGVPRRERLWLFTLSSTASWTPWIPKERHSSGISWIRFSTRMETPSFTHATLSRGYRS